MKKLLLFIFLIASLFSQAQFQNTITSGNASTLQRANGAYGSIIGYVFAGSYGDTTAANLSFIKNIPGIVIRNIDTLWQRNSTATAWIKIGGGSGSGGVNSGNQYRIAVYNATGTTVSENAAITGNRALISNSNGLPTNSTTTSAEIGYVSGVTSPIQGQLNTKETAYLSASEQFTNSTSMSITISNTPLTTKDESYYLNGLIITNWTRIGTTVTFTGFIRETSDIITAKYSYLAP